MEVLLHSSGDLSFSFGPGSAGVRVGGRWHMKFAGDRFGWVYRYAVNFSAAGGLGTLWVELWVDFWGASSVLAVLVIAVVSKSEDSETK